MTAKAPLNRLLGGREHAGARELAAIVEASRDAIWGWKPDGTITSWNAAAERLFGYSADEIIGKPLTLLVPPDRLAKAGEAVKKLRDGGWIGHYETFRLRKDGVQVPVELTVSPVRDDNGLIVGAATICRDNTQRRESEQLLAKRINELAALYSFTDRLHRADGLAEIYDAALAAIGAALECERASILLFDDDGVMRFVAWRGLSDSYRKAVDGHSPWTPNEKNPVPICVRDVLSSQEPESLKQIISQEGIRGLAFFPLVAAGRLIGKFMTYYAQPHEFSTTEIDLALTIGRQVAFGVEQKRAQQAERTLTRELQHRTNNLLTVVQAIANKTLSSSDNLATAKATFQGRIKAMARAHQQLVRSNWSALRMSEIIRLELEPFGARAEIESDGDAWLPPHSVQNFSLALHELATNAVKHGALSVPEGRVRISWDKNESGRIAFQWRERGGPRVSPPEREGFGSALLKSTFGPATIEFGQDGISCHIEIPSDANIER